MGELLIWYHGLVVGFDGRAGGAIILLKRDCPSGVSRGCFVCQGAVGPLFIVMAAPGFDRLPCLGQRSEPMLVKAFVPKAAEKALDIGVLDRLAGFDETQPDAGPLRSFEQRL